MHFSSRLPEDEYNLLMFFACVFLSIWGIKASFNFFRALQIRASVLSGSLVNIRGLSESLHFFDTATRSHVSSLIQTRRSEPPKEVPRLYVPFHIFGVSSAGKGSSMHFDLWCAGTTRVVLVERLNVTLLDGSDDFYSAEDLTRHLRAGGCLVNEGKTLSAGRHRIPFHRNSADEPSLALLVIPLGRSSMTKSTTSNNGGSSSSSRDDNSGNIELSSQELASDTASFTPLWAGGPHNPGGNDIELAPIRAESNAESWQALLDFGLILMSELDGSVAIDGLVLGTNGQLFRPQEMFGNVGGGEGPIQDSERDCVVCLTEQKEIILLPCRHMCVCQSCFIHIDKCPVCRCAFDAYVAIDLKKTETLHLPQCPKESDETNAAEPSSRIGNGGGGIRVS